MKKINLLLALFLTLFSIDSFSQCVTQIIATGGTSGNARCPMTRYRTATSHYLITAAEMTAAGFAPGGTIDGISWNYSTAPSVSGVGSLKVYLENTNDVANLKGNNFATAIAPMTKTHDANTTLPAAAGFFNINFSGGSPFTYTGGGIYVAFDWEYCAGTLDGVGVVSCQTQLANGIYGYQNNALCNQVGALAASSFRPDTRFIATIVNDVKVEYIYTIGETPLSYTNNHVVSAIVTNRSNTVFTNYDVTLNISGANSFTNVQTIGSLAGCGSQMVTFAPFVPVSEGNNTVQVTIPPDNNNGNNSKQVTQTITKDRYSYRYIGEVVGGGVGVNNATAATCAKFNTNASLILTHVSAGFNTAGLPYRIAIYGANGATPSTTPLYIDANDRISVIGVPIDLQLETPVTIPSGDFYVGIHQQGITNMGLDYATETPLRSSTFYFGTPLPIASWMDLAPANGFRLMLGVKFCYPYTPSAIIGNSSVCEGSTQTYSVTPIPEATSYTWTLPGGWTGVSISNSINATVGANGGNISCVANYLCGTSPTTSLAVTVNPKPIISATASPSTICSGNSSSLTASGANTYIWNPGAIATNPASVSPSITTTYTVTGTDLLGCIGSTTLNVTVDHLVTGTTSATPNTICLGESSSLDATITPLCFGSINNFTGDYAPVNWTLAQNNSNGSVNVANAPTYITMNSGTNLSGTPGTTSYSIPVSCSGNINFSWSYSHQDAFGSIFDYPQYSINGGVAQIFPGFVQGGANTQTGTASISVNAGDVFEFIMATIDNDATPGKDTIFLFSAPAPAALGTGSFWDAAIGGNNLGAPPISVTPIVAGANDYYLEVTSGACVNPIRVPVTVTVNPAPSISATATPSTTCDQTSVTPSATGVGTITWSGGLTNNVPFVALATTTYTATATDGNGCTATSTALVTVNPASGGLAPVTSNQTQNHGDGFDINYYDASCDLIATVDDGAGGNVLGSTIATVNVDANAGTHNGQPYVRRWYQITPSSNGTADVTLYINQSDFDDYNAAVAAPYLALPTTGDNMDANIGNIRITKNSDAGLGNNPIVITPTVNWNGSYWELSFNTPGFSQFRVHSVNPMNTPLPATVISFSGVKQVSSDLLSWTTASEQNNAYFNLQHSTDGAQFTTIAKVNSKGINGNSNVNLTYNAENREPKLGHNYYRLEQVDMDGKVSVHAKVIDLIWGADGSTVSIYPNPTTDVLNIDLYAPTAQNTSVKVLDMSGRVVKQVEAKSSVGNNHIEVSLGEVASGLYTVQVYSNSKLTFTSKVRKND